MKKLIPFKLFREYCKHRRDAYWQCNLASKNAKGHDIKCIENRCPLWKKFPKSKASVVKTENPGEYLVRVDVG